MPDLDLDNVEVEEIEITDDVYSTRCSFNEILKNEEAKAVITKYLGDISENSTLGMMMGIKIDTLATMSDDILNEKILYTLNKELTKVKKSK